MAGELINQDDLVSTLIYTFSIISATGSCYIIFRLRNKDNVAQRLIIYLSIADFLFSISNIIYVKPGDDNEQIDDTRCSVQAFLRYASLTSSLFAAFFISFSMYMSVIRLKAITDRFNKSFKLCIFVVPLLLAMTPLLTDDYGSNQFACGFKSIARTEELLLFYIPLWITTIVNIILVIKVISFFNLIQSNESSSHELSVDAFNERSDVQASKFVVFTTLSYPIIQAICWLPYTIEWIIATENNNQIWKGISFLASDSQGLFNALAYIITSQCFNQQARRMSRVFQNKISLDGSRKSESLKSLSSQGEQGEQGEQVYAAYID